MLLYCYAYIKWTYFYEFISIFVYLFVLKNNMLYLFSSILNYAVSFL